MHTNYFLKSISVILVVFLVLGCRKDDGINIALNREVNEFIWQGLRTYYFWQEDVPDLADDRFETFDELHAFLNQYSDPESLFDHFIHEDDRFSWISDDFEELDKALLGNSLSFGYEFNLVRIGESSNIFGYVEYVLPNSPAELAGLKRGDVYHSINGVKLAESNFSSLISGVDSQVLSLGDFVSIEDGVVDNGKTISLSIVELIENPVFLAKTLEVSDIKVGYLLYNQFTSSFNGELNAAIGQLKSEGISELVLDLRYNSGGSITTARVLASMLYDDATSETVLGSIIYNSRLSELNADLTFLDQVPLFDKEGNSVGEESMNRLDLRRIFILTGSSTASASELVITGLDPYMDVTLIGSTTVGKNLGSITLYDSPDEGYLDKARVNPNHKYAMQPIISQLANSVGFTDYANGIEPNIELIERNYLGDLKPLGAVDEPLLAEALGIISGTGRSVLRPPHHFKEIYNSRANRPFAYVILDTEECSNLMLTKLLPGN